jgi:hypothetical protein
MAPCSARTRIHGPGCNEHNYTIPPEINSAGALWRLKGPIDFPHAVTLGLRLQEICRSFLEDLEDMGGKHRQTDLKGPRNASSVCYRSERPRRQLNTVDLNHSASSAQFGGKGESFSCGKAGYYHELMSLRWAKQSRIVRSMVSSCSFAKKGICAWNLT